MCDRDIYLMRYLCKRSINLQKRSNYTKFFSTFLLFCICQFVGLFSFRRGVPSSIRVTFSLFLYLYVYVYISVRILFFSHYKEISNQREITRVYETTHPLGIARIVAMYRWDRFLERSSSTSSQTDEVQWRRNTLLVLKVWVSQSCGIFGVRFIM